MCGVCGEVRFDGGPASAQAVRRMSRVLASRGPDGRGEVTAGRLAAGHRRLAVIDPGEGAAQPMVDPELGLGVVYNGAIYNHRELRAELERLGYRFSSASDTEVLLKAYHAWGEDFVLRLDGMFAFALWERENGRLLLGRDRLGIKPLFWSRTAGALRFASTLPALLAAGGLDAGIDPAGLNGYLTLHGVIPAPRTLVAGARKLPPATLLRVEADGRTTSRPYWRLEMAPRAGDADRAEAEWRERTLDLLRRSVERRLLADVPVGVLLSGGLDSSLVVALLADLGHRPLDTFSVGFEPAGDDDELTYARRVAERCGTEHHTLRLGEGDLLPAIEGCVRAMSEPQVNPDCLGFYLLAREVSKSHRVVLTGQGADEIFAGYPWYPPVLASAAGLWAYMRRTFYCDHAGYLRAVSRRFARRDWSGDLVAEHFAGRHASREIDHALHFDATVLLPEGPLQRVDAMTMASGVEARAPFLSHDLVELAARMPAEIKVSSRGKRVLRSAARDLLPAAVLERDKAAFPVPPLQRLRGPYLDFVRDVLGSRRARERGIFRRQYLDAQLARPDDPWSSRRLWQAVVLELWLDAYF